MSEETLRESDASSLSDATPPDTHTSERNQELWAGPERGDAPAGTDPQHDRPKEGVESDGTPRAENRPPERNETGTPDEGTSWQERLLSGVNDSWDHRQVDNRLDEAADAHAAARDTIDQAQGVAKSVEACGEGLASMGEGFQQPWMEGYGERAEAAASGQSEVTEMIESVSGETLEMMGEVFTDVAGATAAAAGEAMAAIGDAADRTMEGIHTLLNGDIDRGKDQIIDGASDALGEGLGDVASAALQGGVKAAWEVGEGVSEIAREVREGLNEIENERLRERAAGQLGLTSEDRRRP